MITLIWEIRIKFLKPFWEKTNSGLLARFYKTLKYPGIIKYNEILFEFLKYPGLKSILRSDKTKEKSSVYNIIGCGKTYTDLTGDIASINYPGNYEDDQDCRYSIDLSSSGTSSVNLTFVDFQTEGGADFVYVMHISYKFVESTTFECLYKHLYISRFTKS